MRPSDPQKNKFTKINTANFEKGFVVGEYELKVGANVERAPTCTSKKGGALTRGQMETLTVGLKGA
jgi:hypothetical protein